jgi:hypothetical protein
MSKPIMSYVQDLPSRGPACGRGIGSTYPRRWTPITDPFDTSQRVARAGTGSAGYLALSTRGGEHPYPRRKL